MSNMNIEGISYFLIILDSIPFAYFVHVHHIFFCNNILDAIVCTQIVYIFKCENPFAFFNVKLILYLHFMKKPSYMGIEHLYLLLFFSTRQNSFVKNKLDKGRDTYNQSFEFLLWLKHTTDEKHIEYHAEAL